MRSYKGLLIVVVLTGFVCLQSYAQCPTTDLSGDCIVDFEDLNLFAIQWLSECDTSNNWCSQADFNTTGAVDFGDFSVISAQWLTNYNQPALDLDEDFETGDFSKYPWQHIGDAYWSIVSDTVYEGNFAAKSGQIYDEEISTLQLTVNTEFNTISFLCKVSSESNYDFLEFYIDEQFEQRWSGDYDWTEQTYTITPGEHTFRWSYTKDYSVSSGEDCAWIDNVRIYNVTWVTVPQLIGLLQADAQAAIESLGLTVGNVIYVFSNTVAQGYVVAQSPEEGIDIFYGQAVDLEISVGLPPVLAAGITWVSITESGFTGDMSKYETTNAQYCEYLNAALASGDVEISGNYVVGANGSNLATDYVGLLYYFLAGIGLDWNGAIGGGASRIVYENGHFTVLAGFEDHPVTYVSWYGATAFAGYYGWRLPTPEQWQAVADYNGSYIYGCGYSINNSIANYLNSYHPFGTTAVGSFGYYGYGMADMAGNVSELTSSIWSDEYPTHRVMHGGSWRHNAEGCEITRRGGFSMDQANGETGFRVCR